MNFKEMLQKAIEKKGTVRELAKCLDVAEQSISNAKSGIRGLPDTSCVKLAQILGIEWKIVIAARNEWTAKTDEEREFWHPLANAAGLAAISVAFVTSFVLPSPAEAAPVLSLEKSNSVYYVK